MKKTQVVLSCAAAIAADIAFLSSDEKTNSLMYSSTLLIDIFSILLSVLMRLLRATAELPGALFLSVLVPAVLKETTMAGPGHGFTREGSSVKL